MFPTILAVLKRSGVEFDLGPQHAKDAVLKRIVPKVGSSDEVSVSRREAGPKSSLHVERPEALSVSNRWCDDRVQRTVIMRTRWQTNADESCHDIISVLLVP